MKLVRTNSEDIYNTAKELLINKKIYKYGDGLAGKYIVDSIIKKYVNK